VERRAGRRAPARRRKPVAGKKKQGVAQETADENQPEYGQAEPQPQPFARDRDSYWWEGGQKVKTSEAFSPRKLDTPLDKLTRKTGGRRSRTRTERKRGRYIQSRPARGKTDDLAFDATLRAAAPMQVRRARQRAEAQIAFAIETGDLQRKIRVKRAANLILFVVDASWSMAVAERMSATKGAIMSLLTDAYQRRDRVGLIVFQKNKATLVLPPTNSVQLAQRALADIPVGGKTPLSAGLTLAAKVFEQEKHTHPDVMPLMILLTDGAGNVSMTHLPPQEEAHRAADLLKDEHIRGVVINMEHAAFDQGLARALAERLGAPCYTLRELKAESLYRTVKDELEGGKQ
jgi:magnesium chelatase subunit D